MATKLTVAAVAKYAPQGKRREIGDTTTALVLVIQPSGTKSWAMRFRRPDGRAAKLTLGDVDHTGRETLDDPVLGGTLTLGQARELAGQINRQRARGVDVVEFYKAEASRMRAAAADASASTFGGLAREFFIHHRTKWGTPPRRWRDDARLLGLRWAPGSDPKEVEPTIIKGSLVDTWSSKPVGQIDAHDVIAVIDGAVKGGIPGLEKTNAGSSDARGRKMFAALSGLFRWLQQRRKITVNPAKGVWHPGAPPSRDRILDDDEIRLFWAACETLKSPYGALLRFLLLTGCRRGDETSKIQYDEIDDQGVLTIPKERTKNHLEHKVPLPQLALDILNTLLRSIEEQDQKQKREKAPKRRLVFGDADSRPPGDFSRVKGALDEEMQRLAKKEGRTIEPWRIHDLRRSCASGMQAIGIRHEIVEKALNHVSGARSSWRS
jgi:integrase